MAKGAFPWTMGKASRPGAREKGRRAADICVKGSGSPVPVRVQRIAVAEKEISSKEGRDVILVDNVVDTNYYDTDNANSLPRIAGFFTSAMPFYHDRNVITIDSYDWTHGTGEDPPHEPSSDPCLNRPA